MCEDDRAPYGSTTLSFRKGGAAWDCPSGHVGAPEAPGPFRKIQGTTPIGQLCHKMFQKLYLALPIYNS